VRVEAPPVIAAFDLVRIEVAAGKRHTAVRASVLQGERTALRVTPENERDFEQHGFFEPVAPDPITGQSPVPEAGEHQRVRSLALRGIVEHGDEARVLQGEPPRHLATCADQARFRPIFSNLRRLLRWFYGPLLDCSRLLTTL